MRQIGTIVLAVLAAGTSGSVAAQQQLAAYYASISAIDMQNSAGRPLSGFGAMLQQDRANYHRFLRRDPNDEGDPFFADPAARAAIPQLYANGRTDAFFDTLAVRRVQIDVLVFVCGQGGRPTYLVVDPADGDGYTGC